jgi:mRNA-degrading endonuclease RelE of RelBE toxin-antitoxin system
MRVIMTRDALEQFNRLPVTIKSRVDAIAQRLTAWPAVSGAKPLRGPLKGTYRIRTGDWRVLFIVRDDLIIIRIEHRSTVYEE